MSICNECRQSIPNGDMYMKTYIHDKLEDLPEDTRTLAEQQRDALLRAARIAYACLARPEAERQENKVRLTLEFVIALVEAGKAPS